MTRTKEELLARLQEIEEERAKIKDELRAFGIVDFGSQKQAKFLEKYPNYLDFIKDEEERAIVSAYYGLNGQPPRPLKVVANLFEMEEDQVHNAIKRLTRRINKSQNNPDAAKWMTREKTFLEKYPDYRSYLSTEKERAIICTYYGLDGQPSCTAEEIAADYHLPGANSVYGIIRRFCRRIDNKKAGRKQGGQRERSGKRPKAKAKEGQQ